MHDSDLTIGLRKAEVGKVSFFAADSGVTAFLILQPSTMRKELDLLYYIVVQTVRTRQVRIKQGDIYPIPSKDGNGAKDRLHESRCKAANQTRPTPSTSNYSPPRSERFVRPH